MKEVLMFKTERKELPLTVKRKKILGKRSGHTKFEVSISSASGGVLAVVCLCLRFRVRDMEIDLDFSEYK